VTLGPELALALAQQQGMHWELEPQSALEQELGNSTMTHHRLYLWHSCELENRRKVPTFSHTAS